MKKFLFLIVLPLIIFNKQGHSLICFTTIDDTVKYEHIFYGKAIKTYIVYTDFKWGKGEKYFTDFLVFEIFKGLLKSPEIITVESSTAFDNKFIVDSLYTVFANYTCKDSIGRVGHLYSRMECGLTGLNKSRLMDSALRISYPNVRFVDTLNTNSLYYNLYKLKQERTKASSPNYMFFVLIILSAVLPFVYIIKSR
jgi:hypothetical protein